MLIGDALCDGQAQPGPFGIAGDHRQKEPWQEVLWHPGAVVTHLKRADQLVASATDQKKEKGVTAMDIAKRLLDFGRALRLREIGFRSMLLCL